MYRQVWRGLTPTSECLSDILGPHREVTKACTCSSKDGVSNRWCDHRCRWLTESHWRFSAWHKFDLHFGDIAQPNFLRRLIRPQERLFALSIAASRVPKAASLHHLHRKGLFNGKSRWQPSHV